MEEFYPMPVFFSLEVRDIAASAAWYQRALGFRSVYEASPGEGGKPNMVHLRRERYQDIMLFQAATGAELWGAESLTVNFSPGDTSVREIADSARAADSMKVEGPIERPWNVREVTVYDPDGYRLRFSEPIDLTKTFDEVMGE